MDSDHDIQPNNFHIFAKLSQDLDICCNVFCALVLYKSLDIIKEIDIINSYTYLLRTNISEIWLDVYQSSNYTTPCKTFVLIYLKIKSKFK